MTDAANLEVTGRNGVSYAYRRFGNTETSAPPMLGFIHCRANLDNWDPALVDEIARHREVILVDNAGVGGSGGLTPNSVAEMAGDLTYFIDALGLKRYDVLGFSLGGFVAQELALIRPHQVRRLVLAGTGPQGGRDMHVYQPDILAIAAADTIGAEEFLTLFFESSDSSRSLGWQFLKRLASRTEDRDVPVSLDVRDAQLTAISAWGVPDETKLARLAAISAPVLVANGDNDRMVPTKNSFLLAEHIPNARLKIYPDAGHGFLFQYSAEFAAEVNSFLGTFETERRTGA
ncbi:alpha/beta fold hydrolase [Paractinoplanes atraurantiacus]|uniref:Pimeloyl-ACP methyl ester carboxylesterase n=1 Tax=Paractinoplanes atraurantiacus TaxID=1036182 RepID=A0A285II73_9ACTN|nr:alpha/beta hydrolase [Actinoplanes atraurantiacus]SNY47672.1 Pimeloyl-ACP methyl ester carboxylesterase [Actinoplanes atraurantiacus]